MYCKHTRNTLERVMKASSNANRIHIRFSKIELDADFDFSGPDYKTTYLSLSWCGSLPDVGDQWIEHPTRLEKIIKAISECKLKDTLTTLNMYQTKIETDIVEEMLMIYDMENINIIYEDPEPLG